MKQKLTREIFLEIKDQFGGILKLVLEQRKKCDDFILDKFKLDFPNVDLKIVSFTPSLNKHLFEGDDTDLRPGGKIRYHENHFFIVDLPYSNSEIEMQNFIDKFWQWLTKTEDSFIKSFNFLPSYLFFDQLVKQSTFQNESWSSNSEFSSNTSLVISNKFKKRKKESQFYQEWNKYVRKTRGYYHQQGFGYPPYFPGDEKYDEFKEEMNLLIGDKPKSESDGERKIRVFLQQNGISFKAQHRFKNCFSEIGGRRYKLPFDFFIPEKNIAVEYDGEQHFRAIDHFGGFEGFEKRKIRDEIKNTFCKLNSIDLIRIPFTEKENISVILSDLL